MVAKSDSNTAVAISSKLASEVYDLDLFATNIQDQKDNSTRFLILKNSRLHPPNDRFVKDDRCKALLSFSINHESPGSLAKALDIFKQHNLNLTSINSRPSRQRPWHYIFLVEFEFEVSADGTESEIETALKALGHAHGKIDFIIVFAHLFTWSMALGSQY
ncbi:uncharacterized protein KY384_003637 [Bacidia gigantensis]|uniref:uncharacterized protein n=1 Tax=Bacidia gigantensis TaxID=2732470 RepID=UPI001D056692|nr:uncharacterized protein KY384_003637 [Bacidia gigantensis]KAG8532001.1 hypothetical protein KY384_003637 [Bacidia gigantensis]